MISRLCCLLLSVPLSAQPISFPGEVSFSLRMRTSAQLGSRGYRGDFYDASVLPLHFSIEGVWNWDNGVYASLNLRYGRDSQYLHALALGVDTGSFRVALGPALSLPVPLDSEAIAFAEQPRWLMPLPTALDGNWSPGIVLDSYAILATLIGLRWHALLTSGVHPSKQGNRLLLESTSTVFLLTDSLRLLSRFDLFYLGEGEGRRWSEITGALAVVGASRSVPLQLRVEARISSVRRELETLEYVTSLGAASGLDLWFNRFWMLGVLAEAPYLLVLDGNLSDRVLFVLPTALRFTLKLELGARSFGFHRPEDIVRQ